MEVNITSNNVSGGTSNQFSISTTSGCIIENHNILNNLITSSSNQNSQLIIEALVEIDGNNARVCLTYPSVHKQMILV